MNSGKANQAAVRIILWSAAALLAFYALAWIGYVLGNFILFYWKFFAVVWALFIVALLYLSRDPDPIEPSDPNAIVAPAHGTVDVIDEQVESEFVQEACQRISIRVSWLDIHVQYAPVSARVAYFEHHLPIRSGGSAIVETLTAGLEPVMRPQEKIVVRLVGGTWGRRIVPWIKANQVPARSTRIGLMRLGSRVDLFLPRTAKLAVALGDKLAGGQSVVAKFQ